MMIYLLNYQQLINVSEWRHVWLVLSQPMDGLLKSSMFACVDSVPLCTANI